jgi:hypothetical protein
VSGFITMHRDATEHPLFKDDAARLGAWVWLLAKACWKPTRFSIGGAIITLERGEICASRSQLSKAWGWSPSAVERFLTRLETEQMIGRETGQGRTVITICNYSKYQDIPDESGQATGQDSGQPSDSHRTTKEPLNQETKELEGGRERENGGSSPTAKRYAFQGKTIRLNQRDFDLWKQTYHAIPDLNAELDSLDDWWQRQTEEERADWWGRTKRSLNRKHQELLRSGQGSANNRDAGTDAFIRRMEKFEAKQREAQGQ